MSLVTGPLSKHPRMTQQDAATVQLVLSFFRNLLAVPDEEQMPGRGPLDTAKQLKVRVLLLACDAWRIGGLPKIYPARGGKFRCSCSCTEGLLTIGSCSSA